MLIDSLIFLTLYENVLQNVLTLTMSRNLSQISPRQHISNYSSNQSMVALRTFCKWYKPKKFCKCIRRKDAPRMEKMAPKWETRPPKGRKKVLRMEKKPPPPQEWEKGPTNRFFSVGASAYSCPPPVGAHKRMWL